MCQYMTCWKYSFEAVLSKLVCFREPSEILPSQARLWIALLPTSFREPSEPSALMHTKKTFASERLPRTFRVKRPPSSRPLPGCHCVANTILAYGTLTRTLRTASAQIPLIFSMFSDSGDDQHHDHEKLDLWSASPSWSSPSAASLSICTCTDT